MKSSSGRPSSRPPRRALATPRVAARPRLRWPLLRLWQHRREGPPPKHGLQGARAARPTLLPQDRPRLRQGTRRIAVSYHDAILTRSLSSATTFNLLLHETFGGGFSPTAVLKLRRLARKVARSSVDRTAYSPKYSLSFMSHHMQSASLSLLCRRREPRSAPFALTWQPCLHVSRAREQGSRPQMTCEC